MLLSKGKNFTKQPHHRLIKEPHVGDATFQQSELSTRWARPEETEFRTRPGESGFRLKNSLSTSHLVQPENIYNSNYQEKKPPKVQIKIVISICLECVF